ncbi:hypothetical protein O6H91_02G119200 [Diphasiastrum complanatum]|nr:hypothetical protein O6H91_02G119200 [Diphasiastrum complanatum]
MEYSLSRKGDYTPQQIYTMNSKSASSNSFSSDESEFKDRRSHPRVNGSFSRTTDEDSESLSILSACKKQGSQLTYTGGSFNGVGSNISSVNMKSMDETLEQFGSPMPRSQQNMRNVAVHSDISDMLLFANRGKNHQVQKKYSHEKLGNSHERSTAAPNVSEEGWPLAGLTVKSLGSLGGIRDANCMEQLLVRCATALETNDVTLAQQIMWVLNNIASAEGDPNQRASACFLRALVLRASRMVPNLIPNVTAAIHSTKILSAIKLAEFVDLIPWYRFGFSAANGAILEAFEGKKKVHILDFSTTYCMQWPTLIDALAKRPEGPPHLRLTVHGQRLAVPPSLEISYDDLGKKLFQFARSRNVSFEFKVLPVDAEQLKPYMFDLLRDETLAVNSQFKWHYIQEESIDPACSRDEFLRMIRSINPSVVTLVDEDADLTSPSLVTRLKVAFNYFWIPFDALETFMPRDSKQRLEYEGDIGGKIENLISYEGLQRIERIESKEKWMQRMNNASFRTLRFSEAVISNVKSMLADHAAGWGLKREDDAILLTWKGHNAVFATAWVPVTSIHGL